MLSQLLPCWDLVFVRHAREALQLMHGQPADVVVSDLQMDEMDGATFLGRVKEHHPGSVRIVLSGTHETTLVCRSVQVAHQFFEKPLDAMRLGQLLRHAYDLRALVGNEQLLALVCGDSELPAAPASYTRLVSAISQPRVEMEEVAHIVSGDVGLSARLMQVAGSAFFGRRTPPRCVRDAVVQLGLSLTKSLTLTFEIVRMFDVKTQGFSIEAHQRRSLEIGLLVNHMVGGTRADDAQLAGMLHGVGTLVLASRCPREHQRCIEHGESSGISLAAAERALLGASHAEVGGFLLGIWGLPEAVVLAVAHHQSPSRLTSQRFDVPTAVYLATRLMADPSTPCERCAGDDSPAVDECLLERQGVLSRLAGWREAARGYRGL